MKTLLQTGVSILSLHRNWDTGLNQFFSARKRRNRLSLNIVHNNVHWCHNRWTLLKISSRGRRTVYWDSMEGLIGAERLIRARDCLLTPAHTCGHRRWGGSTDYNLLLWNNEKLRYWLTLIHNCIGSHTNCFMPHLVTIFSDFNF